MSQTISSHLGGRISSGLEPLLHALRHDVRAPLRTTRSFAALLARRCRGQLGGDADELLGHLETGAEQLERMLEGLTRYVAASAEPLAPAPCDPSTALARALASLKNELDPCEVEIQLPSEVIADSRCLERICRGLVQQLLHLDRSGPARLRIWAERQGHHFRFGVEEKSAVLPVLPREPWASPFFQLGSTKPADPELSICKLLLERQGGRLWLEGAAKKGAAFGFTLPAPKATDHPSG